MTTATATWGALAGAKDANQAYGGLSGVVCAVPVLPATDTPSIFTGAPVPWSTTLTIIWVICWATSPEIAWDRTCGSVTSRVFRSGPLTLATT